MFIYVYKQRSVVYLNVDLKFVYLLIDAKTIPVIIDTYWISDNVIWITLKEFSDVYNTYNIVNKIETHSFGK